MPRPRKQVIEAKDGPLELRREKGKGNAPVGKKRGEAKEWAYSQEGGESTVWVLHLKGFKVCEFREGLGGGGERISEYSSA